MPGRSIRACRLIGVVDSHEIRCETELELANLSFRSDSLPEELDFLLETCSLCCRFRAEEFALLRRKFDLLVAARPEEPFARAWTGAVLLELLIEVVRKAEPGWSAPPPRGRRNITGPPPRFPHSSNHPGKLFRDATGMSFSSYVTGILLNRACFLLTNTDMPLKELAAEAGFRSPEYFHKVFREQLLRTPDRYRRDVRQEAAALQTCSNL